MKKILLILSLIYSANALSDGYIHFSNDTDGQMRVLIKSVIGGRRSPRKIIDEIIVEPHNVKFFKSGLTCAGHYEIEALGKNGSIVGQIKILNNPANVECYYAYIFSPVKENGKDSFKIRQRIKDDAKLILEEHKSPQNPRFIDEIQTIPEIIQKSLDKEKRELLRNNLPNKHVDY